jgi:hypothetical protein
MKTTLFAIVVICSTPHPSATCNLGKSSLLHRKKQTADENKKGGKKAKKP